MITSSRRVTSDEDAPPSLSSVLDLVLGRLGRVDLEERVWKDPVVCMVDHCRFGPGIEPSESSAESSALPGLTPLGWN